MRLVLRQAIDNARLREALEAKLAAVNGAVEAVAEPPRELPAIARANKLSLEIREIC